MPMPDGAIMVTDKVSITVDPDRRVGSGDGGPTICVFVVNEDGNEIQALRFDCFKQHPHYHYNPGSGDDLGEQFFIDRVVAGEDTVAWVLETLENNLPEMLEHGGHSRAADAIADHPLAVAIGAVRRRLASGGLFV